MTTAMKRIIVVVSLLLSGCGALVGPGLVPGKTSATEVQASLGEPALRTRLAGGDTMWYYPRQPQGRQTYGLRIGPDGTLRSMEQLLTEENMGKLSSGSATRDAVREQFGPPWRQSSNDRAQREVWEYAMFNNQQWPYYLYAQFSSDGVLRELYTLKDYVNEPGSSSFP
jgi:hypothetical protein